MRQGQQNRRGRGRNNNRKGHHNPLSRSFESNGPDVKIRGTPAHIAEKYISYARDAQSSGDLVLAENYFQHAEHYTRIIMAYREQFNQPGEGANGGGPRMRGFGEMGEGLDEFGDDAEMGGEDGFAQPFVPPGPGPQPRPQQAGGEHSRPDGRPERPFRRDQNRPRYGERGERQGFSDRDRQGEARPDARTEERGAADPAEDTMAEARRRDRFQQVHEQPEFLRRSVRRARSENGDPGKNEPNE
ncbi:MAG: DUF4167 domain-containing protein [Hyphomicrobiaceae bacterium]|nr:DUF4167 domain-containing protein [Hyphomicrobiaceae bacterium]